MIYPFWAWWFSHSYAKLPESIGKYMFETMWQLPFGDATVHFLQSWGWFALGITTLLEFYCRKQQLSGIIFFSWKYVQLMSQWSVLLRFLPTWSFHSPILRGKSICRWEWRLWPAGSANSYCKAKPLETLWFFGILNLKFNIGPCRQQWKTNGIVTKSCWVLFQHFHRRKTLEAWKLIMPNIDTKKKDRFELKRMT